jgi:multisubunit Na+/H+ antiporter MnhB subunit
MNVLKIIEYLRAKAAPLKIAFFVFLGVLVLLDIFLPRQNAHYFVDTIYAYWTLFSLVGCFVLIKVSKGIAHMFLSKDEDYYG